MTHVQHSLIGDEFHRGISGGQRKRVNIGIELAATPVSIFLDEPTSGLDSTSALEICDILKQIANLGLTVVSIIHQPRIEIFQKFDDVILLAPGGRTVYQGPTSQTQGYFEKLGYVFPLTANPADVYMDILSGKCPNPLNNYSPDDLVAIWEKAIMERSSHFLDTANVELYEMAPKLSKERGTSIFWQLIYCHQRSLKQQMRTPGSLILEAVVGLLAGLVMGASVYRNDKLFSGLYVAPYTILSAKTFGYIIPQFSFLIALASGLAASPPAVNLFAEEKLVYWRETAAGHSPLAYFIAKNIASLYRILIASL